MIKSFEVVEIERVSEAKNLSKDSLSLSIDGLKLVGSGQGYHTQATSYPILNMVSLVKIALIARKHSKRCWKRGVTNSILP